MRNAHTVQGWKLTPASSTTTYQGKEETTTIAKLTSGTGADGYHVESPSGASCFFVQRWDCDGMWTAQTLEGTKASTHLRHSSPTLKLLLERLRNVTRALELETQLRAAFSL